MSTLDDLPPDQRAVLELVLVRGRNYDQIAQLLAVDRASVRERALAALDALAPQTRVAPERRALITDYLLGQLPGRVSDQVRDQLADGPADRAWARIVASELATVAGGRLPEIPPASADRAPANADHAPTNAHRAPTNAHRAAASRDVDPAADCAPASPDHPRTPADADPATAHDEAHPADRPGSARPSPVPAGVRSPDPGAGGSASQPAADAGPPASSTGAPRAPRRGSRKGGAFVLVTSVLVIAVVLIVVFVIGGGHKPKSSAHAATARGSTTSTASTGTPAKPTVLAQVRLSAPTATSKAQGIAEAFSESGQRLLAVVAINLAANKNNYYAVWLTNGASASALVGYERVAVTSNGRLQALGPLPANTSRYTRLELTLEPGKPPANGPATPGTVVLSGTFNLK